MKLPRPIDTALWPLRKLAWLLEDEVLWPLSDALRSRRDADGFRQRRAWTRWVTRLSVSRPSLSLPSPRLPSARLPSPRLPSLSLPGGGRLRAKRAARAYAPKHGTSLIARRDVRLALATVAVAAGAGVAIAALTGPPGGSDTSTAPPVLAATPPSVETPPQPPAPAPAEAKQASTLEGVTPDFKPSKNAKQAAAKSTAAKSAAAKSAAAAPAAAAPVNPLKSTNSKPSTIPAALANETQALRTVRNFSGAFVLYEVGRSGPKIKQTFARTATPSLAKALRDRPPRLPGAASVPQARVQNVLLGKRQGRTIGASVSLLRLGDLSELRLTLTLRRKAWAVSEVRG